MPFTLLSASSISGGVGDLASSFKIHGVSLQWK